MENGSTLKESFRESQQIEEKLERYRVLAEHARDIMLFIAPDGRILEANRAAVTAYGYDHETLCTLNIRDLRARTSLENINAQLQQARLAGVLFETEHQRADGTIFPVEVSSRAVGEGAAQITLSVIRDISERRRAAARLQESEDRFHLAFAAVQAVIYDWNLKTDEVMRSAELQNLIGFKNDEPQVASHAWYVTRLHPDDAARACQAITEALAARAERCELEYRLRHQDGHYVWVRDCGIFVRDATGQPERCVGSLRNIDHRKQAEEALRASELRQRLAQQAGRIGIFDWDFQTSTLRCSDTYREIFDLPSDAPPPNAEQWLAKVHPDDRPRVVEKARQIKETSGSYRDEYRIVCNDGSTRWVETRGEFIRDDQGHMVQLLGTSQDITARKEAEEAIKLANYRFRVAEEAARGFNYEWNLATGEVTRSSSVRRVLGYKRHELSRTWEAWAELIHPDDRLVQNSAEAIALLQNHDEESFGGEYRVRHKDGHYVWMMERGLLIRDERSILQRVIGQTVDITEHKKIEAEREQLLVREKAARQLAEEANRAKEDWLALVSHELRTPLNAMLGHARLLHMRREHLTPELADFVELIRRNGERQNEIINDLLDTARITTGKLRLEIAPLDLAAIIEDALAAVQPSAQVKDVQISAVFAPDAGKLTGDATRLQQAVLNLLGNAVKFTPAKGSIEIHLQRADQHAVLSIKDTGQGIAPDFLPHVFERFTQQDMARTRRVGGLGLGLALVKQIIELHGGTIVATSEGVGCGATFTMHLPIKADQTEASRGQEIERPNLLPSLPLSVSPALAGVRLLVLENDPDTRASLQDLLEAQGATVRLAADAAMAWTMLMEEARPDILVCDIGLSVENGSSWLRRVREWERARGTPPLPALALTSHGNTSDRLQALMAGFHMHVVKPVEPNELVAVLESLLERARLTR